MRISCFADEISPDLNEQLRVVHSCGLQWLELRSIWDTGVLDLSAAQLKEAKLRMDDLGIGVSCIGSPLGKLSIDSPIAQSLEQLHKLSQIAWQMGTRYVRCFTFFPGEQNPQDCVARSVERLCILARAASKDDIILLNENEPDVVGDSSERCANILNEVNHANLRAVFDPSNFRAMGEKPFDESLPRMLPFLEYVHIKDSKNGTNEKVLAGEGDAQVPEVLNALRSRTELFLSLEPHLALTGLFRGFSGEAGFRAAHGALAALLEKLNADADSSCYANSPQ